MNLCHPDSSKSCAACCGIYNVQDGRPTALRSTFVDRTRAIRSISHSVDALVEYADRFKVTEPTNIIDPAIHVCEYAGFVDESLTTIGCMLHPCSPGNNGVDYRGLCYYGSMACKSFYCPACQELDGRISDIIVSGVQDWHLYGLVITDVNFVSGLFRLIELDLGRQVKPDVLSNPGSRKKLLGLLSWKNSWPYAKGSTKRRSAYYFKPEPLESEEVGLVKSIVENLAFTFDISGVPGESHDYVRREIGAFVKEYSRPHLP